MPATRSPPAGRGRRPRPVAAGLRRNLIGRSSAQPRISVSSSSGFGPRDDAGITGVGKARAGIGGEPADDLALAAVDDDVGHGLGQVGAGRNRHQVACPLVRAILTSGSVAAGWNGSAHGRRPRFIVGGEPLDHPERGKVDGASRLLTRPGRGSRPGQSTGTARRRKS